MESKPMSKTALLLLDLQNEMVDPKGKLGGTLAGPAAERNVLANAATALEAARTKGMVVAFVRLGFRPDYQDCLSVASRVQKGVGARMTG
jgi:nicotinamidase-related amidase